MEDIVEVLVNEGPEEIHAELRSWIEQARLGKQSELEQELLSDAKGMWQQFERAIEAVQRSVRQ